MPIELPSGIILRFFAPILLASIIHPPVNAIPLSRICLIESAEDPSVKIKVTGQTAVSIKGFLLQRQQKIATFSAGQSNGYGEYWWMITDQHNQSSGTSILFSGNDYLNRFKDHSHLVFGFDRVLFVGLSAGLWYWNRPEDSGFLRDEKELLKSQWFTSIHGHFVPQMLEHTYFIQASERQSCYLTRCFGVLVRRKHPFSRIHALCK